MTTTNERGARSALKWISVNDRMPDECETVIGWEPRTGARLVQNAFDDMEDVTHWMSLPEGPTGAEG